MSAYTSSQMIHRSWRSHTSPMASTSSAESTAPVGLLGVLSSNTRVRGVTAASMASARTWNASSGRVGTPTNVAPVAATTPS